MQANLRKVIRNVPDFPKQGIQFKDITTLTKDGQEFAKVINLFDQKYRDKRIEVVVGVEARGFIFGGALAYKWGIGFVPVRKPGKLPAEKIREEYQLEYGIDALEIHTDAIRAGQRVLLSMIFWPPEAPWQQQRGWWNDWEVSSQASLRLLIFRFYMAEIRSNNMICAPWLNLRPNHQSDNYRNSKATS